MEGGEAVNGCGIRFVKALVELLWYIDGRHHVFENQGCTIPKIFADFKGYNVPETSKHRKRMCENMSADILHSHSTFLLFAYSHNIGNGPSS
jgi:orotidine-5'-phosphate decarboxylase